MDTLTHADRPPTADATAEEIDAAMRGLPRLVAVMLCDLLAESDGEMILSRANGYHPSTRDAADRRGLIYPVPGGEHRLTVLGGYVARKLAATRWTVRKLRSFVRGGREVPRWSVDDSVAHRAGQEYSSAEGWTRAKVEAEADRLNGVTPPAEPPLSAPPCSTSPTRPTRSPEGTTVPFDLDGIVLRLLVAAGVPQSSAETMRKDATRRLLDLPRARHASLAADIAAALYSDRGQVLALLDVEQVLSLVVALAEAEALDLDALAETAAAEASDPGDASEPLPALLAAEAATSVRTRILALVRRDDVHKHEQDMRRDALHLAVRRLGGSAAVKIPTWVDVALGDWRNWSWCDDQLLARVEEACGYQGLRLTYTEGVGMVLYTD